MGNGDSIQTSGSASEANPVSEFLGETPAQRVLQKFREGVVISSSEPKNETFSGDLVAPVTLSEPDVPSVAKYLGLQIIFGNTSDMKSTSKLASVADAQRKIFAIQDWVTEQTRILGMEEDPNAVSKILGDIEKEFNMNGKKYTEKLDMFMSIIGIYNNWYRTRNYKEFINSLSK